MRCKDKEDFVLANYKNMSYDEIGKILGITRNSVQYYLTKNGIRKMERELTPEELEFIQHNYKTMTYKEIAKEMGVSVTRARQLVISSFNKVLNADGDDWMDL